jgi:hypothetical protein
VPVSELSWSGACGGVHQYYSAYNFYLPASPCQHLAAVYHEDPKTIQSSANTSSP